MIEKKKYTHCYICLIVVVRTAVFYSPKQDILQAASIIMLNVLVTKFLNIISNLFSNSWIFLPVSSVISFWIPTASP